MKNLIVIPLLGFVMVIFVFVTILTYDAISGNFYIMKWLSSSCSKKKVEVVNQSANKVSADTMILNSYKKKQVREFSELVKKLKERDFVFNLIKVDLSHGSDPYDMEKPPVTTGQLEKWTSFDFIVLTFPDGLINGMPGILSIHCDNYDRRNPEFFAKIKTVKKTSYGFSEKSIPYYMARTGKESISEIEKQKYVLEAIKFALYAIKINVACDRVLSTLLHMEQEEELGRKPPSVRITTEDTVSNY